MGIRAVPTIDHQIVPEHLRLLVRGVDDMESVGEASDREGAVRLA